MGRIAKEITNRNELRSQNAAGGWEVIYGDLINEADVFTFIISIPTGTVGGWVQMQIAAQLSKFAQSLADVSDDVARQATTFLENIIRNKGRGEADFGGLGVKGGFLTYDRHMEWFLFGKKVASHNLPNNHQPYIALRITKPLPPKGATVEPVVAPTPPAPTPVKSPMGPGRTGRTFPKVPTIER